MPLQSYMLQSPDPNAVFEDSYKSIQAAKHQQVQRQQAERMAAALGQLGPNATPADYQGLISQFPDLAKPLTERYQTFDDARKNALFGAGQQAFMLLRPGADGTIDAEAAAAALETSAAAFENSNAPDIAKQLRDSAKGVRMNPGAAKQSLGMMLAFSDPERFKKVGDAMGQSQDTAFQKDYAFIKGTFGQGAADTFANSKIDETAMVPLPNGKGVYVGPRSGLTAALGGATASAAPAPPRLGEIRDGYRFKGGNPADQASWEKVR